MFPPYLLSASTLKENEIDDTTQVTSRLTSNISWPVLFWGNKQASTLPPTHYPPKKMNYLLSHDFAHYLLINNPSQTTHNTHTRHTYTRHVQGTQSADEIIYQTPHYQKHHE